MEELCRKGKSERKQWRGGEKEQQDEKTLASGTVRAKKGEEVDVKADMEKESETEEEKQPK